MAQLEINLQDTSFEVTSSGPSLLKRRGKARVASDHIDALAKISQLSTYNKLFGASFEDLSPSKENLMEELRPAKESSKKKHVRSEVEGRITNPSNMSCSCEHICEEQLQAVPHSSIINEDLEKAPSLASSLYSLDTRHFYDVAFPKSWEDNISKFAVDTLETELESVTASDEFVEKLKHSTNFDMPLKNLENQEIGEHRITSLRSYDKFMRKFKGLFIETQRST